MEEAKYQVYCHWNKLNGKAYYGATKNTWQERWKTKYKHNLYFHRAIEKYREEDWVHEIVAEGLTREKAAELEKVMIAFFDTKNRKNGYNIGRGGEGINNLDSLYAKMRSKEYHEALSEAMKRVWASRTDEERKELAQLYTSHFTKEQLSEQASSAWRNPKYREKMQNYYKARKEQRESDPTYIQSRELAKQKAKERAHRYHVEHYNPVDTETKHRHYSDARKRLWENEEYRKAASDRMREIMKNPQVRERIRDCRTGTKHTEQEITAISNGMKEKWKDHEFRTSQCKPRPPRTEEQKERARSRSADNGRSVLCVETGEKYPTINGAARAVNCDPKHFRDAIHHGYKVRGYHWVILEEKKEPGHSVLCIETGTYYETITKASNETGISKSGICGACTGKRKTAGGLHWKYGD